MQHGIFYIEEFLKVIRHKNSLLALNIIIEILNFIRLKNLRMPSL